MKRIIFVGLFIAAGITAAVPQTLYSPPLIVGGSVGTYASDDPSGIENISVDGARTVLKTTAYGSTVAPVLHFDRARGTQSSPSYPLSGDGILSIGGRAWNSASGFGGSSVALIGTLDENTSSGMYYTASHVTIGTTPTGAGRQDWFNFTSQGNLSLGTGCNDTTNAGFHTITICDWGGGAKLDLANSTGTVQATMDSSTGDYLYFGTRADVPVLIVAHDTVGITLDSRGNVRFNQYATAGVMMNDASGNITSHPGVSCSGIPGASFHVTNGIVDHC